MRGPCPAELRLEWTVLVVEVSGLGGLFPRQGGLTALFLPA